MVLLEVPDFVHQLLVSFAGSLMAQAGMPPFPVGRVIPIDRLLEGCRQLTASM